VKSSLYVFYKKEAPSNSSGYHLPDIIFSKTNSGL
jgi:hypothetical protein